MHLEFSEIYFGEGKEYFAEEGASRFGQSLSCKYYWFYCLKLIFYFTCGPSNNELLRF